MEFNARGFGGTDTNKIARRAGFAPQTFYRWFPDKTAIFLAAYRRWETQEMETIQSLRGTRSAARRIVAAIVAHHRAHLGFRRSLRLLAYENDAVRKARAESRRRQLTQLRTWMGTGGPGDGEAILVLLQMERLSDAIAEGEIDDLDIDNTTATGELLKLVIRLGSPLSRKRNNIRST
jgi:AcrR family transcriptional regulator